jgi:hypothetical protein
MLSLVIVFLVSSLLAGCQKAPPTLVSAEEQQPTGTNTPVPTHTPVILPPTSTPIPAQAEIVITRTPTPTRTATLNVPQTMAAIATADKSAVCHKLEEAWIIKVTPSWKKDWCSVKSLGGQFYEYLLDYPAAWTITTFGDVFPNMAFSTGEKGVEVRLYQVYDYAARNYEGTLADAPVKASFCDSTDKCDLVIGLQEKISAKQTRNVGGKEVLVVDSQDGKYNIRRYFFFVPFRYAVPKSNRLFFIKLYTPEPITGANYTELESKIEGIITSIKHDF